MSSLLSLLPWWSFSAATPTPPHVHVIIIYITSQSNAIIMDLATSTKDLDSRKNSNNDDGNHNYKLLTNYSLPQEGNYLQHNPALWQQEPDWSETIGSQPISIDNIQISPHRKVVSNPVHLNERQREFYYSRRLAHSTKELKAAGRCYLSPAARMANKPRPNSSQLLLLLPILTSPSTAGTWKYRCLAQQP